MLSDLVSFDTSINPAQEVFPTPDCANYIIDWATRHNYENIPLECSGVWNGKTHPIYPVLLVKRGKLPGPTVLYLGHIDVVPVSDAEIPDWKYEPFKPVIEKNLLYGRGSGDMKGGVVSHLLAFCDNQIKRGNVVIAISGDEEIGGMDSVPDMVAKLEKMDLLPDYVINAEGAGEQVIVTQRRGGTQISFTFDLDYDTTKGEMKSAEFSSSHGVTSESLHSMSFILGADIHAMIAAGKFSMERYITHVESSSIKTNAVPKVVKIKYIDTANPQLELKYSRGLTKMMNALASIGSVDWPIVPSKYGPSVCPNLIDIDQAQEYATITFDIRSMLIDSDSHEVMVNRIQEHFRYFGLETEARIELAIDPVNVRPDHPFAQKAKELAQEEGWNIMTVGEKLGGASDTRFFTTLGIPGIEIGPIAHNGHGMNESVDLDTIESLIRINQKLFRFLTTK